MRYLLIATTSIALAYLAWTFVSRALSDSRWKRRNAAEDRANAEDPSAVPASCARAEAQGQGQEQVGRVVAATADTARRANFSEAFQRTLLFEVAVFLACFLLVFLLPDARGDGADQHAGAAAPV